MDSFFTWLNNEGIQAAIIIIGASIAIYIGNKILTIFVKQFVRGKLRKASKLDIEKRQQTLAILVRMVWRIIVIAITAASVLKLIFPSIDFTPLFASAGIVGIAVAFGAQSLVKDFLTGVFIISENQYRVGDIVSINDADGRVEHIGARSTVIRDDNGNVHYLPNGSVVHVINKTMGYSRVYFTLLLNAETDLDNAISVINQVGDKLADSDKWKSKVLSAPQFSEIGAVTGSSIEITISGKTQPSEQWQVTAEMRRRLLKAFEKHGIKLA
jgi:small conductance mechanosensitive channel